MTDITPHQLELAREWAKDNLDEGRFAYGGRVAATARVIASLPDEWIDADQLRDVINGQLSGYPHGTVGHYAAEEIACKLEDLFPAPQPRTLADLLAAGHAPEEYQWMQADFRDRSTGRTTRTFITRANRNVADVVFPSGDVSCVYSDKLTPLPDLPRMVWPDEHYPTSDEDVSIIPPKIDTSTGHDDHVDMTPEDVPEAELWLVEFDGKQDVAVRELPGAERPWWLMRGWRASDEEITLVSRLVPEVKA